MFDIIILGLYVVSPKGKPNKHDPPVYSPNFPELNE